MFFASFDDTDSKYLVSVVADLKLLDNFDIQDYLSHAFFLKNPIEHIDLVALLFQVQENLMIVALAQFGHLLAALVVLRHVVVAADALALIVFAALILVAVIEGRAA